MAVSQALITILSSKIQAQPIVMFDDMSVLDLVVRNEGWSGVVNPVLQVSIGEDRPHDEVTLIAEEKHTIVLKTFDEIERIPLQSYLPERLRDQSFVAVWGEISYGVADNRKTLRFNTRVSLQVRAAAPMPARGPAYQAFFTAGEAPVTKEVGIHEKIQPRGSGCFLIRLATNETSQNRVKIDFQTPGGEVLPGGEFQIDLFVPRSAKARQRLQ
jgi:hypothetical protein